MLNIVISENPVTKKNHQRIVNIHGHYMVLPSKQYVEYEKACKKYMPEMEQPIDYPVNIKCVYYMPTKRRVDLTNLISATMDILVYHGVLKDDNRNIAYSNDGSRVFYDKEDPRAEITITEIGEEFESWGKS